MKTLQINTKWLTVIIAILLGFSWVILAKPVYAEQDLKEFRLVGGDAVENHAIMPVLIKAYKNIGYELSLDKTPSGRALLLADEGKYDGVPARIGGLSNIYQNMLQIDVSLFTMQGFAIAGKNLELDQTNNNKWQYLENKKLVCVRGVKIIEFNVTSWGLECQFVLDYKQAFGMLERNRAEILIGKGLSVQRYIEDNPSSNLKVIIPDLFSVEQFHYIHKKHHHLFYQVSQELQKMVQTGEAVKLYQEYIAEYLPSMQQQ